MAAQCGGAAVDDVPHHRALCGVEVEPSVGLFAVASEDVRDVA
jgi:hypothetical protein